MAFQRGEVVLIPFPYSDLSAVKTRPAVVVSSDLYHAVRPEILVTYVSSQVAQAHPLIDYVLRDWAAAGLPKPSFVRPKVAAIEPNLVVHRVGALSTRDQRDVDHYLRRAMALTSTMSDHELTELDLTTLTARDVQQLAEKSLAAAVAMAATGEPDVDLDRLRILMNA